MNQPENQPDLKRIACNYAIATSASAKGSLAYVLNPNAGNGFERMKLLSRSRGHRWIEIWEPLARLENFRAKTISPEDSLYVKLLLAFDDRHLEAIQEVVCK